MYISKKKIKVTAFCLKQKLTVVCFVFFFCENVIVSIITKYGDQSVFSQSPVVSSFRFCLPTLGNTRFSQSILEGFVSNSH